MDEGVADGGVSHNYCCFSLFFSTLCGGLTVSFLILRYCPSPNFVVVVQSLSRVLLSVT